MVKPMGETMGKHASLAAAKLAVMREVGYVQKQKAAGLPYSFAGEAAIIEALRPAMVEAGLTVSPCGVEVVSSERYDTANGKAMNRLVGRFTFRMTHADSKEAEESAVLGEAADSGDKCVYKATTGAYKYFLRQSFALETGNDPDKHNSDDQQAASNSRQQPQSNGPSVKPAIQPPAQAKPQFPATPQQLAEWVAAYDRKLSQDEHVCQPGDLTADVIAGGVKDGMPDDLTQWPADQMRLAWDWVKMAAGIIRQGKRYGGANVNGVPAGSI